MLFLYWINLHSFFYQKFNFFPLTSYLIFMDVFVLVSLPSYLIYYIYYFFLLVNLYIKLITVKVLKECTSQNLSCTECDFKAVRRKQLRVHLSKEHQIIQRHRSRHEGKRFYNRETIRVILYTVFTIGWNPSTLSWLAERGNHLS